MSGGCIEVLERAAPCGLFCISLPVLGFTYLERLPCCVPGPAGGGALGAARAGSPPGGRWETAIFT